MSRCYPFPPPGYEKKARVDDTDLLRKEKHREKKHKKEKKDREKREAKEKREKDKSDGKHRDKKDKKEKHKDRKKDKEKDRDKDKERTSTSTEKRVAGQSESCDGKKFNQKEKNQDNDKGSISDERTRAVRFLGKCDEQPVRKSLLAEETEESRFLQELDRRIRDEPKGAGSRLVERFTGADKKDDGMDRLVVKNAGTLAEGKDKNKDGRVDSRKMDGRGIKGEAGFSGNAEVQNIGGIVQNRKEGILMPIKKTIERTLEAKERSKEKEANDKQGDKHKNKKREKNGQLKDRDREKEKKKDEKVKEKNGHKFMELDRFKDSNKNDLIGTHSIKNSYLHDDLDKIAGPENLGKRKDFGANGFLHDDDVRPPKVQRPTSNPLIENGKKLEPCRTPIIFASNQQGTADNLKVDNKDGKLNGTIEVLPSLAVSSMKPPSAITHADPIAEASRKSAITHADPIAEASRKPAHPDSKYLSQVLSVPKMEDWSGSDDQEWLFSSNRLPSKKPAVDSTGTKETPWVWAGSLHIESADVCALPYVIPY